MATLADYQKEFDKMVRQATANMQEQVEQANKRMQEQMELSMERMRKDFEKAMPPVKQEPKAELREDGSLLLNKEAVEELFSQVDNLFAAVKELEKTQ